MRVRNLNLFHRHALQRSVLLFGVLLGLAILVTFAWRFPVAEELDFHAYYFTGIAVVDGAPFIGWAVTEGAFITGKAYVYTPVTALVFAWYALFPGWVSAYLVHFAILFVSLGLLGLVTIRFIERRGGDLDDIDRWLLLAFCTVSVPAAMRLTQGNIDPIMVLLLTLGVLAIEADRETIGGSLWAVVALFKLFPVFLGVWLLYRRAYRAITAAIAVGLGGLLLGVAIFGIDAHIAFVEFIVNERSRQGAFLGGLDPTYLWITLRRPLSHLFMLDGHQLTLLATWMIAPFVALVYMAVDSELDRFVAYFATLIALLVTIVPSTVGYVIYVIFPLLGLLYLAERRAVISTFALGLLLVTVPIYPHHIERALTATSLPSAIVDPVIQAGYTALTYGSIALWGMLIILAGCLLYTVGPHVATFVEGERHKPRTYPYFAQGLDTVRARPQIAIPFAVVFALAVVWELYDGILHGAVIQGGLTTPSSVANLLFTGGGADPTLIGLITLGMLLGVSLVVVSLIAMATAFRFAADDRSHARVGDHLRRSLYRLPAFIIATVIAGVLFPIGLALFLIPGLYVALAFAMAGPAIIVDGYGPIECLRRGWELARANFLASSLVVSIGTVAILAVMWIPLVGPVVAALVGLPALSFALARMYLDFEHPNQSRSSGVVSRLSRG